MAFRQWLVCLCLASTIGCAHKFPKPTEQCCDPGQPTAAEIFQNSFAAHGGNALRSLNDVSFGLDGHWHWLITRIQPLVTDHRYRVRSEERILVGNGVYAAHYQGPAGSKQVLRTPDQIRVGYNRVKTTDADTLSATALTADSFYLFLLGPLALDPTQVAFTRLANATESNRLYYRIHAVVSPGLGLSERDEIVLWIDALTWLTYRVHITLQGHRTTQGAHVDVTYGGYRRILDYTFPSRFNERVRGPIAITAHRWWLTGLDINRGLLVSDLNLNGWTSKAKTDAEPLPSITP